MNEIFNYDNKRARQARLGASFGGAVVQTVLYGIIIFALLGGSLLLFVGQSIGWLVISLIGPAWSVKLWGRALQQSPSEPNDRTIEGALEAGLLAKLSKTPTPKEVAVLVEKSHAGMFFSARFMLGQGFMSNLVSDRSEDMAEVWRLAQQYRAQYAQPAIDGAVLSVALVQTIPNVDEYLAHVGLSRDELESGIVWYQHVEELIAESKKRRKDGGIGRDWSFGYTPLLNHLGFNISEHIGGSGLLTRELGSRAQIQQQLMHVLSQAGRRNVMLVGQLGSGKTKIVHELAQRLMHPDAQVPRELHYDQIIALDPSTLMSQARGRGELEDLVQRLCYEALKAKNTMLFLDDAHLFFEEGSGSVDISNVLLPVLDGGALQIIMAIDEQRWVRILQNNPGLVQYINKVIVTPTNEHDTLQIMQNQLVMHEYQQKVTYTYQALQTAYKLSQRYIADQVMPGRALKLLESAAQYSDGGLVTKQSVEQAIEQTQGVRVATADSSAERETLLNLEALIHERMINQSRAVKVVSDALRRARAGVRNTSRPIGTFLFLGPTGVGKTELAKSVAAVFFGHEDQLVRLDLNEYVRSEDVSRLIADAAQDQFSLTAQISRQPFSVVLLDEIEKAHPEVLNTLLQVLDEGILRDINNREVSFRDAVIIATSNAGADQLRAHIEAGEQLEDFEEQFTNELISSNTFRPEFLNRYDEIVLFRPLEPVELLQVIDLILKGVNKTLTEQKLTVVVEDDGKRLLVEAGYDPRLGARPMRRIVQRTVENIVANQVLSGQVQPGSQVVVTRADIEAALASR